MRMAILAAACLALAACAQTGTGSETASAAAPERDCFRNADISGYNVIDEHTVTVSVGTRSYTMTTLWNARDLDWTHHIAVRSATDWICTGSGLGVEIVGGEPRRAYPIDTIVRTPEPAQQQEQPAQGS